MEAPAQNLLQIFFKNILDFGHVKPQFSYKASSYKKMCVLSPQSQDQQNLTQVSIKATGLEFCTWT